MRQVQFIKILSVLLIIIMLFSTVPLTARGQEAELTRGSCGDSATYSFDELTGVLTISGSGEIAAKAFSLNGGKSDDDNNPLASKINPLASKIRTVLIEDGITGIGVEAFRMCEKLRSVSIPDSVTRIGAYAFAVCTLLEAVNIPDSVIDMDIGAFAGCLSLATVKLPDGLTEIKYHTFESSRISSIEIPASVTDIGGGAFYGGVLQKVVFWGNAPSVTSSDNRDASFNTKKAILYVDSINTTGWTIPEWKGYNTVDISELPTPILTPTPVPTPATTPTPTKAPTPTPKHTIVFNANGGTGTMTSQTYTAGVSQKITANTFKKTGGYKFTGWATTPTGTAEYTDAQSIKITANKTLYAVWEDRFALNKDAYSFKNANASFGYTSSYRIPLERFQEVFGAVQGKALYDERGVATGGVFGISATTGLFYTKNLNTSDYNASTVYGIQTPGSPNSETTKLIEKFQISQWQTDIAAEILKSFNNTTTVYSEFITAVQNFQETGEKPVIALLQGNGRGRAVIAYKVVSNGNSNYTVSLYDSNYPNQQKSLTVNTSTRAWNYEGDFKSTADGSRLCFINSQTVGENMGHLLNNSKILLTSSSANVDIYNSKGVNVTALQEAILLHTFDNQRHNDVAYYLPKDTYHIVPKRLAVFSSGGVEPFRVGVSDGEIYISLSNKDAFEAEVTLGSKPALEIKGVTGTDAGDFNISITTTNTSLKTDKITVYKTEDNKLTASLTGSKPVDGTAIGVIKAGSSKESFGATTTEFIFNSEAEQPKATSNPKAKPIPTAKPIPNFIDVSKNAWYAKDVNYVVENGLMNGTSKNIFSPNMNLTRGMIVTILYRQAGSPDVSKLANPFSDVKDGQFYTKAVKWAAANKIVQGSNGKFNPNDNITRQDFSVILYRYAKFASINMPAKRNYSNFADQSNIASYAKGAVETFYKAKIVNGKTGNNFDPKGNTTRAEGAAMLHRFLTNK